MNTRRKIQHLQERINNLKSKINEVLSSPYPFTIDTVDVGIYEAEVSASFTSAGSEYMYTMLLEPMILGKDIVLVGEVIFADEDNEVKLTGKGDAFRVMATVIEITRKLLTDQSIVGRYTKALSHDFSESKIPSSIEAVKFSADPSEISRLKLYERIAKNLPGFTLITKTYDGDFFLLSNKTPTRKKQKVKNEIERHGL